MSGHQHHIIVFCRDACIDQAHILGQLHGDLAVGFHVGEVRERIAAHLAGGGRENDLQIVPLVFGDIDRHEGRNRRALRDRQNIDHSLAPRIAPTRRQPPSFELIDYAIRREE